MQELIILAIAVICGALEGLFVVLLLMRKKRKAPLKFLEKETTIKFRCGVWKRCKVRDPDKCPFSDPLKYELCHEDFRK